MASDRFQRLKKILLDASALRPQERARYLDEACRDDPELRAEVESLLAHEQAAPSRFLDKERVAAVIGNAGHGEMLGQAVSEAKRLAGEEADHPRRIGPYRIVSVLGEGGMGIVYLAEQTEPIRRQVAVKLIRRGLYTNQVVTRFAAERQTLALMNHPNIARVLDAGSDDWGRPYFVMDLVTGVPITEFCEQNAIGSKGRIQLMLAVVRAIQHAHQKGVIHRDLKPSNLLVTMQDGVPTPKVIDFGIAKALAETESGTETMTREGQPIGTIHYMSPEQARGASQDIDVRSDVYCLGVIMYELLTGVRPYETTGSSFMAQVRMVSEQPVRPFRSVLERGRSLDEDLETIVLKALAKDPEERYPSAAALAEDIERYLASQPILARPPSVAYQLRKLIARNKLPSFLAAGIVVMVIGFGIWMSVLYVRSEANLKRATRAESESQQVSDFMIGIFEVANPGEALGDTVTARELLDRGAERIADELDDQPVVQTRLMRSMGQAYRGLGLYARSDSLLGRALTRSREIDDDDGLEEAAVLSNLASLQLKRGLVQEAEHNYQRVLEIRRFALPPDHPQIGTALANLGSVAASQARYAEAEQMITQALEILENHDRRLSASDAREIPVAKMALARIYDEQNRFDEADSLYRLALTQNEELLPVNHPLIATNLNNLATLCIKRNRYAEAGSLLTRSLAIDETILRPDHPDLVPSLINMAHIHRQLGELDRAEEALRRALAIQEKELGPDHVNLAFALNNLAFVYRATGRDEEAVEAFERSLLVRRRALGEDHPAVATALNNLGEVNVDLQRYARADSLFHQALAIREAVYGRNDFRTAQPLHNIGALYLAEGRLAEAEALLLEALAIRDAERGPVHKRIAESLEACAELMRRTGRITEAQAMAARADTIWARLRQQN